MAIAFEVAGTSGDFAPTYDQTSASWNHTITSSTAVLYVMAAWDDAVTSPTATYNGVSMTALVSIPAGAQRRWCVWRLVAPATGTNAVAVAWTTATAFCAHSVSYTGVDQTTPDDTPVNDQNNGSSSNCAATTTSATGDIVLGFAVQNNPSGNPATHPSIDAGTSRAYLAAWSGSDNKLAINIGEFTGASSVTADFTAAGSNTWGCSAINLNAAAGGASILPFLAAYGQQ
jgi:hypothetical protein